MTSRTEGEVVAPADAAAPSSPIKDEPTPSQTIQQDSSTDLSTVMQTDQEDSTLSGELVVVAPVAGSEANAARDNEDAIDGDQPGQVDAATSPSLQGSSSSDANNIADPTSSTSRRSAAASKKNGRKSAPPPKGRSRSKSTKAEAGVHEEQIASVSSDEVKQEALATDEPLAGTVEDADGQAEEEDETKPITALESEAEGHKPESDQPSSSTSSRELSALGLTTSNANGSSSEDALQPRRSRRAAATSPATEANAGAEDGEALANLLYDQQPVEEEEEAVAEEEGEEEQEEAGDGEMEGVTRCVCGSTDENVGLMIQCETCKCWQHCVCMGMHTEEDCPDVYFCEQCRPELHMELLRSLGVLPVRSGKRGGSSSKSGARLSSKEAARELREAREAVALLAKQNAQRRDQGQEPLLASNYNGATAGTKRRNSERRTTSESHDNPPPSPHGNAAAGATVKSPKRRSTMNSRDSAYGGWEAIPPGLLNEDEVWQDGQREEDDAAGLSGRKRKRSRRGEEEEERSPSPIVSPPMGPAEQAKRRRMSGSTALTAAGSATAGSSTRDHHYKRRRSSSAEDEDSSSSGPFAPSSQQQHGGSSKRAASGAAATKAAAKSARNQDDGGSSTSGRPKQPNQYTYRKERLNAAANNSSTSAATGGRLPSPTPSPSKTGRRGAAALREGSHALGSSSRSGTPVPGEAHSSGRNKSGGSTVTTWALPDHLSHLAHMLPTVQPEPLSLHLPTTKGMQQSTKTGAAGTSNTREYDDHSRPSPHPFTTVEISEAPTKVRFPGKRMTMGEMRKRVRNISEYVTRMQMEAVERGKRMKALGIEVGLVGDEDEESTLPVEGEGKATDDAMVVEEVAPTATTTSSSAASVSGEEASTALKAEDLPSTAASTAAVQQEDGVLPSSSSLTEESQQSQAQIAQVSSQAEKKKRIPVSMRMMDELSRQLMIFQQKYGGSGSALAMAGSTVGAVGGAGVATGGSQEIGVTNGE